MDKFEYKVRAEEIKSLIAQKDYVQAAEIADTIDWRRVKSVMMLCTISDLYKINRRYEDARDMLLLAYDRHPGGRTIVYSLCELSIKMEEFVPAVEYYKEFIQIAPRDTGRYILQYKLYDAQDVSLEERIAVLEELKKRDYREKWAYELAYLYHRVGLSTRCVEECDELILWFGDGKYVLKAMELKMLHQPLTAQQQQKYEYCHTPRYQQTAEPQKEESSVKESTEPTETGDGQVSGQERDAFDIQVKTMDVSEYNTINLQKELAEGLKEVLDEESVSENQPIYIEVPVYAEQMTLDVTEYAPEDPSKDQENEQIAGQLYIDDVLAEWERLKREAAQEEPAGSAEEEPELVPVEEMIVEETEALVDIEEEDVAEEEELIAPQQVESEIFQPEQTEAEQAEEIPVEKEREKEIPQVRNLTKEEKELFGQFIQNRSFRQKLVTALDRISMAAHTGNVIITGDEGIDTMGFARNLIRDVQMTDGNFSGKTAKISGAALNQKDATAIMEQLGNGALIIQKVSGINENTVKAIYRKMQQDSMGIIVVIEDTRRNMARFLEQHRQFAECFTARVDMEALSNDMLVAFGKKYAREMEYSIDELGILALHTRIEELQTIDHAVTVIEVKEIVDDAIYYASRKSIKHFLDVLLGKRYDEEDMIILREKDFR